MKEIVYKLKDGGAYKGTVDLKSPSPKEKLKLIKELNYENVGSDIEKSKKLDIVLQMVELTEKHLISMDVVHIASGERCVNLDDIAVYSEWREVCLEVGEVVIRGVSVENPKGSN